MSIDTKQLNMQEKIKLFKQLYKEITAHGHPEDVHLAHVNEYERKLLIAHGGCGTVNDETGLTQYFGGGGVELPHQIPQLHLLVKLQR